MVLVFGEFSICGGIVDIYLLILEYLVRIEFFDIEVDLICSFNLDDQRLIEIFILINIGFVKELIIRFEEKVWVMEKIDKGFVVSLKKLKVDK